MSNTNQFDWVPFYRKVADRLLDFQDDRTKLVSKVKQIFKRAKLKLPTLERDNAIVDMDPLYILWAVQQDQYEASESAENHPGCGGNSPGIRPCADFL